MTWFLRAALPLRITARHQESQPATQNYSTQKSHHQGSKIAIKKDQPPPKPNTQARSMASGAPDVQYFVEKSPVPVWHRRATVFFRFLVANSWWQGVCIPNKTKF